MCGGCNKNKPLLVDMKKSANGNKKSQQNPKTSPKRLTNNKKRGPSTKKPRITQNQAPKSTGRQPLPKAPKNAKKSKIMRVRVPPDAMAPRSLLKLRELIRMDYKE